MVTKTSKQNKYALGTNNVLAINIQSNKEYASETNIRKKDKYVLVVNKHVFPEYALDMISEQYYASYTSYQVIMTHRWNNMKTNRGTFS